MFGKILIYLITAALIVLIFSPNYFAYTYLFTRPLLQPFAMKKMMIYGIPITGIMALVLIGYTSIWIFVVGKFKAMVPNVLPLYFLSLAALLSFINTVSLYESVSGMAKLMTAVMAYVLIYNIAASEKDARKILIVITLSTILPMLVGYYQFIAGAGGKAIGGETNRVIGTLGFANAFGIYLALSLGAAIMLLLHPRWKVNKYFLGAIIASIIACSVLSLNRGTWIALASAICISTLFYLNKVKLRYIIFGVLVVGVVFSKVIIDRFGQLEDRGYTNQNTFERRVEYWKITLDFVPEHAIVGWGIGTAQEVMLGKFDVADVTHNDYLRLQLETGILGLGAYVTFLGRIAWLVYRRRIYMQLWYINYPMMIVIIYFMIISLPQNIIDHMVNLPLFLCITAVYQRLFKLELGAYHEMKKHQADFRSSTTALLNTN